MITYNTIKYKEILEPILKVVIQMQSELSIFHLQTIQLIESEWRIYVSLSKPALVQTMACRPEGAKPLSEPILGYC